MDDEFIDIWEDETCQRCIYQDTGVDSKECANCSKNFGYSNISHFQPMNSHVARYR